MLDFTEAIVQFLTKMPFEFIAKRDDKSQNTQFYCSEKQIILECMYLTGYQQHSESEINDQFRTVRIWEDVWHTKTEIVKSRIRAVFGISQRIPARMTKVQRIDKPTADQFLNQNHLQATVTSKLKYGLFLPAHYFRIFYNKTTLPHNQTAITQSPNHSVAPHSITVRAAPSSPLLVAVATFSGSKTVIRDGEPYRSFELIRFANLLDCTVVGGLSKLLTNMIREQSPDDIMSYADRDWSDGNSYQQTGFELIGTTPPQDFWVNRHDFERITNRQKVTEANAEDFIEIQNVGNLKYLLNLKKNKETN